MANPLDTLRDKALSSIQNTAQRLFNQGSSFIQQNPTPIGYLAKQVQPAIQSAQSFIQKYPSPMSLPVPKQLSTLPSGEYKPTSIGQYLTGYKPPQTLSELPKFTAQIANEGAKLFMDSQMANPSLQPLMKLQKPTVSSIVGAVGMGAGGSALNQFAQTGKVDPGELAGSTIQSLPFAFMGSTEHAPNTKAFDWGRNKRSAWHPEEAQVLGETADMIRSARVLTEEQLAKADQDITYLAKSHLPTEKINKLVNDYGRNSAGFLKAAVKELEKSLNTHEDMAGIRVGLVESKSSTPMPTQENQPPGEIPLKAEPTFRQKMSGLFDQALVKSRDILNKMGDGGKEIATKIDNYYNNSERMVGNAAADYNKAVKGLSPQSLERVLRVMDGQIIPLNPQETAALPQLRTIMNGFAQGADQAQLLIRRPDGSKVPFTPRDNYLPHIVDLKKLQEKQGEVIQSLVSSGQMPDIATATNFVRDLLGGSSMAEAYKRFMPNIPKLQGNLEYSRIIDMPAEVLRYDKKLLPDYFVGASRRIHQALNFGPNSELVQPLLDKIHMEGFNAQDADQIVKQNLGLVERNKTFDQGVGAIKGLQATSKLGLSAISNAGQTVNTATKYGIVNTLKGIGDAFTPKGKEFALRTGSIVEDFLNEVERESTGQIPALEKITAPGFKMVERFNRIVAANVGRRIAESKGLGPEEAQKFAQEAVNTTQFKTRPIDLPPLWQNPVAKVLLQFKNFSYQHADFIAKEVLQPVTKGNIAPLTRYLILGLVVGEGIADLKAAVRRRERPTNPTERALDNLSTVGGAGLLQDAFQAAMRGPEAMVSWIAGPTVGDVGKLAGGFGLALQGKPTTLGRFALGNIPVVGQPISNTVFPPKGAYKSRTPDLIQEALGLTPKVGAAEEQANTSFLDKQKKAEEIAKLNKDKKGVLDAGSGINLPIIGRIGGTTDQTKEQQLSTIEKQKAQLAAEKNYPGEIVQTYQDKYGNWKAAHGQTQDAVDEVIAKQQALQTGKVQQTADKYYIPNSRGGVDTVLRDRQLTPPAMTGQIQLDKQKISDYKAQVNAKINDIVKLNTAGQVSNADAEKQIQSLQAKIGKFKVGGKGKKPKVLKIKLPKLKKIKAKKIKLYQPKPFKVKALKAR